MLETFPQVSRLGLEDYNDGRHTESTEWELDEWQLEHLEDLGLGDKKDDPGSEFVDFQ